MPELPIRFRQDFEQTFALFLENYGMSSLLYQMRDWFRQADPDAHTDFHIDPNADDPGKAYPTRTPVDIAVVPFWYRSNAWAITVLEWYAGSPQIFERKDIPPSGVFNSSLPESLDFLRSDAGLFTALSLVLRQTVEAWLEDTSRLQAAYIANVDADNWVFRITWSADAASRWPDAFDLQLQQPFLDTDTSVPFIQSEQAKQYIAQMKDSEGKTLPVRFYASNSLRAREYANQLASRSGAKWIGLREVRPLIIPTTDNNGAPLQTNYRQTAAAGSSVQIKGRATYRTGIPRDTIRVEIPAVKASVVSAGARTSTTDPLTAGTRAKLLTENGAPATSIRSVRYREQLRRSS